MMNFTTRNYAKFALGIMTSIAGTYAAAITVTVHNNSAAVAHVDYVTAGTTITPPLDSGGNIAYLSTTTFTSSGSSLNIQLGQYGATSIINATPLCYYNFSSSGATAASQTTPTYCSATSNSLTLAWPPVADVAWNTDIANNAYTVVNGYLNLSTPNTYMVANQAPLSSTQLENFTTAIQANSSNGWALQFAYDSIRLPLWTAADYAQNPSHTTYLSYLNGLSTFLNTHTCTNSNGNISLNTQGIWAYSVDGVSTNGTNVSPAACSSTPSLEGPLAMVAKAVSNTTLLNSLVATLNSYSIAANTFAAFAAANGTQLSQNTYTSSSSPYFNASLDLVSQALLIGNGSFDISAASGDSSGYLSYNQFMANYTAWLNDGFVTGFNAPIPGNGTQSESSLRVIYSTYNAINYANNNPANTKGNSPTVSEGMGYGLLIAYAANDQATFDKFLKFILSEAYYQGCAGMNSDQSACSVKSQYLMPWMVDETGAPFNYAVAGGYMTSGSAFDADMQIVWPLYLASQRASSGAWKNSTFSVGGGVSSSYAQLATAMTGEINRYEVNYGVTYFDTGELSGGGALFSPGSQWGMPKDPTSNNGSISGTNLIYPGYVTPQAFSILQNVQ